ncbi:MAG TPA: hypothetical protein VHE10_03375 [Candidatus Paceibacterota bacterium]|nr:hypothetical protein [Candidatus Paceibacterota bacterium]
MHALSIEDKNRLTQTSSRFKIIAPLEEIKSECEGNEILTELFENMIDFALRYAESVCRWQRMAVETPDEFDAIGTRQAIEDTRRTVHNAFIEHVNILSRTLVRQGRKAEWRGRVGHDRAALGRFAIVIAFEYIKTTEGGNV